MNRQTISEAAFIGRVLLSKIIVPQLEAFSGNALYCDRGILPMKKYKTVKEVCALTGLTRKHLYYFHHEKVVCAVAYANYSVEGNDGYKLYDDAAVEKLQQIALYYQLGLKRDEIRDIMLDRNYDSNFVLDTLLSIEQAKKATIDRHIAALEYLKKTGTKNKLLTPLKGISLEELGETVLQLRKTAQTENKISALSDTKAEAFIQEFNMLIEKLQQLEPKDLYNPAADKIIEQIISVSTKYLGSEGLSFILGFFISHCGLGEIVQERFAKITPEQAKAVLRYLEKKPAPDKHCADGCPQG